MNVVDLLVTIVVVTILVTIVLAIVTYVAYKLRLAREPSALEPASDGLRYFVMYAPPTTGADESLEVEGHAAEA
jgi:hypothetical protein